METTLPLPAKATTTYNWNGGTGTDWTTGSNWTASGPPTSSSNADINLGSNGPVVSTTNAVSSSTIVGTSAAGGTLTVQSGGKLSDRYGYLGYNSGSTGTVTVTGAGSQWTNSSNLYVGYRTGTLNIEDGGLVSDVTGYLGYNSGSTGTATVTGAGSQWTNSSNLYVGYRTGTLNIEDGGLVSDVSGYLGYNSGSTGTATVTGAGSQWTNSSNSFYVGYNGAGTLTIQDGGAVSVNGGKGTVIVADHSGVTSTLNIGAGSGDTAVAPGTLDAAAISFGPGNGALVFNHTSDGYSFSPVIAGNGTIDTMAGTTILTGDSSGFTGTTDISGGTLEVGDAGHASAALGGPVSLTGGTLAGHGTVDGTVSNTNGTVAPGGTVGTLSASGNYTQGSSGTLAIELNQTTASKLAVTGSAALDGTLALQPDSGTYARGTTYTILTAGSGVTGTFSSVTNSAPSRAAFTVNYGANDVTLTIPYAISNLAASAATADQKSIATMLEAVSGSISSGAFNTTLNTINSLPAALKSQGLSQITSHTAASSAHLTNAGLQAVTGAAASRLAGDPGSITLASDVGDNKGVELADASGLYWNPAANLSDSTVWVQGLGEQQSLGSTADGSGFSSGLGGVAVGFERRPDHQNVVGLLIAVAHSWLNVDGVLQTGTQDTYAAGLYGSHTLGRWIADGTLLFSYNQAISHRDITVLNETAKGVTSGVGASLDGGLGYRVSLGKNMTLTPRAGISWSNSAENGYTETGAPGANLVIGASNQILVKTTLGATLADKYEISHNDGGLDILRPQVKLGWRHDWTTPMAAVSESFAGVASSSFITANPAPGRNAALVGIGISYAPAHQQSYNFYARYDGTFAANETNNALTVGVKYSW